MREWTVKLVKKELYTVTFNVIKAGINGGVTFIMYKRIANFLRR